MNVQDAGSTVSLGIEQSVNDVKFTLVLTLVLVVLVIFIFLRNLSATIIPSLALPLSVLGTFAVMNVLGYSLDSLSMMALTLSVGFVVDDAVVMLENIVRHLEMNKPPRLQYGARRRTRSGVHDRLHDARPLTTRFSSRCLFMGRDHRQTLPASSRSRSPLPSWCRAWWRSP